MLGHPTPMSSCPRNSPGSVTAQHALDEISQRPPEVLPIRQPVLIDKQDIVLEARVEVWFKTQVDHNRVVVTVDVRVRPIQPLEDLTKKTRERLGERNTWSHNSVSHKQHATAVEENPIPVLLGNICSLSMLLCTQLIKCSM